MPNTITLKGIFTSKYMSIFAIAALLTGGNAMAQDFNLAKFENSKKVTNDELCAVVRRGLQRWGLVSGNYVNTNDLPSSKFNMYVYRDLVINAEGYASLDLADSLSLKSELVKDMRFYKDILDRKDVSLKIVNTETKITDYSDGMFKPATDLATGQPIAVRIPLKILYSVEVKGKNVSIKIPPMILDGGRMKNSPIVCGKQMRFESKQQEMLAIREIPDFDSNLSDEHLDHILDVFATYGVYEWKKYWMDTFEKKAKENPAYFYNENESKEEFEARTERVISDYVAHEVKEDFRSVYSKESIKEVLSAKEMCMLENLIQHPKFFEALDNNAFLFTPELIEDVEVRRINLILGGSRFRTTLRRFNDFLFSKELNQKFSDRGNNRIALAMFRSPNKKEKLFAEVYGHVVHKDQFSNMLSAVMNNVMGDNQKKAEAQSLIQQTVGKYYEEQLYTDLVMTTLKKMVNQVTEEELIDFNAKWMTNIETMQKMSNATTQSFTDFMPVLMKRFSSQDGYSKKVKAASCSKDYKKKFAMINDIPKVTVTDVKAKMDFKGSSEEVLAATKIANEVVGDYKTLLLNSYISNGITLEELDIIDEINKHPVAIAMNMKKSGTDLMTQGATNDLSMLSESGAQEFIYRMMTWFAVNITPLIGK